VRPDQDIKKRLFAQRSCGDSFRKIIALSKLNGGTNFRCALDPSAVDLTHAAVDTRPPVSRQAAATVAPTAAVITATATATATAMAATAAAAARRSQAEDRLHRGLLYRVGVPTEKVT
jgi:hypothetical protein